MPPRSVLGLLCIAFLGLGAGPGDSRVAPSLAAPPPPACRAELTKTKGIVVAGHATGIRSPRGPHDPCLTVRTWAHTKDSVLVAFKPCWKRSFGAKPDGKIYSVSCKPGAKPKVFYALAGADFGNAALNRDGGHLFFTGPRGVMSLDLRTAKKAHAVTKAPKKPTDCDPDAAVKPAVGWMRDVVTGLSADGRSLFFERGGPCGYEGDWVSTLMEIDNVESQVPAIAPLHPVASIARDPLGALWLGDFGYCEEVGLFMPGTKEHVWRSTDRGVTWHKVRVHQGEHEMSYGAQAIHADTKRSGHLLVHGGFCPSRPVTLGGSVFVTRDGGSSWSLLPLPPGYEPDTAVGQGFDAVQMPSGDIDHVVVWFAGGTKRMETHDGGKTYRSLEPAPLPPSPARRAAARGFTLDATSRGLIRTENGKKTRVFPQGGSK